MYSLAEINSTSKARQIIDKSFFSRSAELVAPDLIGCKLVRRKTNGENIWGVIVETEAYSQNEPACHGYKRRTAANETLFGEPGRFYIYLTYGIYHCVNIVTDRKNFASGVLLRSIAMAGENERIAAGPGLLAKRFGLDRSHDNSPISLENGLWLVERSPATNMLKIVRTTRIGISQAKELPLRWYLQSSRSISKRAKGDFSPRQELAWIPAASEGP